MKSKSAILLAFALFGCQTATDLRARGPLFVEVTTRPLQTVAGCVGDRLEAWNNTQAPAGQLSTRPNGAGGYSISVNNTIYASTDTPVLVEMEPTADGKTRVQLYTNLVMGAEKMSSLIRTCL